MQLPAGPFKNQRFETTPKSEVKRQRERQRPMDSKGWGKHTSTMVSWSQLQVLGFESSPGHGVVTAGTGPLRSLTAGACDGTSKLAKLGTGETRISLKMPGTGGNVPAKHHLSKATCDRPSHLTQRPSMTAHQANQTARVLLLLYRCCVIPPPFSCRHFDGEDVSCASDEHPKYAQSVGTAPLLSCPSSGVQIL